MNTQTRRTHPIAAAWGAVLAEAQLRLWLLSRYPGRLALEIALPILFAAMPIFLGRAVGGPQSGATFAGNTGSANYVAYLLIGSIAFIMVTRAFWDIAYWLRFEQETGTYEALYLTPTSAITLALGVALYSAVRSVLVAVVAYIVGCLLFRVNPLSGDLVLTALFLLTGLIPIYGLALMVGALIVRVKEANTLMQLVQWMVCFLMGIYFPLKLMPPALQAVALLFPPTWVLNGARASLLNVGYFFEHWYGDYAVLWGFTVLIPLLGVWLFRNVENGLRARQGLGEF